MVKIDKKKNQLCDSDYSLKQMVSNEIHLESKETNNNPWKNYRFVLSVIAVFLVALYFHSIYPNFFTNSFNCLYKFLNNLNSDHPYTVMLIMAVILIINLFLILPFTFPIYIIICFVIDDMMTSFFFIFSIKMIISISIYGLTHLLIYDYVEKKFSKNKVFKLIKTENEHSPWKIGFLTRLMAIPVGLKDYVLSLLGRSFDIYIVCSFVEGIFSIFQVVLIASDIKEINDFLQNKDHLHKQSLMSKIFSFIQIIMVAVSVGVFMVISWKVNEKIKIEEQNESDIELQEETADNE